MNQRKHRFDLPQGSKKKGKKACKEETTIAASAQISRLFQLSKTIGNQAVQAIFDKPPVSVEPATQQMSLSTSQKSEGKSRISSHLGTDRYGLGKMSSPGTTELPGGLKDGIERHSGIDMSDVKVHHNSEKPGHIGAYAYTQGTDIFVAPGQETHIGHEAWHVVQQKQGRVKSTIEVNGVGVNDNPALEREADLMGTKAQLSKLMGDTIPAKAVSTGKVAQRLKWKKDDAKIDINGLDLVRIYDLLKRTDPDPDPGGFIFEKGDKIALRKRADQLLPGAFSSLLKSQISLEDLTVMTERNIRVSGEEHQKLMKFIALMATSGSVIGFDEWIAYTAHLGADQRQDKINELWEAARRLLLQKVKKIDLSETVISGSDQTADLSFDNTQVEVKTIREPITTGADLNKQLKAGLGKFIKPTLDTIYEVVLYASLDKRLLGEGIVRKSKKGHTEKTADPKTLVITNIIKHPVSEKVLHSRNEELLKMMEDNLNSGRISGTDNTSKVTVIMENANSFATTKGKNGKWKATII